MAKIVAVHGIGQQFKGEETLRQEWLSPMKDGLNRVNSKLASDDDLACAFYGDLFRPKGKAALEPLFDASDIREEWERNLLLLWWSEAALFAALARKRKCAHRWLYKVRCTL